jgi:hypothetical protein
MPIVLDMPPEVERSLREQMPDAERKETGPKTEHALTLARSALWNWPPNAALSI